MDTVLTTMRLIQAPEIIVSKQDKPRLEELSGHTRVENSTILWVYLVAFVVAVIIGLILRFAINATP